MGVRFTCMLYDVNALGKKGLSRVIIVQWQSCTTCMYKPERRVQLNCCLLHPYFPTPQSALSAVQYSIQKG